MIKAFVEGALELLYPSRANCLGCGDALGAEVDWLCEACDARLFPLSRMAGARCVKCGRPSHDGRGPCPLCGDWPQGGISFARYTFFYGQPVRGMIAQLKYRGVYRLSEWMGVQLANTVLAEHFDAPDVIVPVPMHRRRELARGLNHAAHLADALSRQLGVPVEAGGLMRIRHTRQQARLARAERGQNLVGAFAANGAVKGKFVLLVDDVLTTGETANGCAQALMKAGARGVQLIALAGPGGGMRV